MSLNSLMSLKSLNQIKLETNLQDKMANKMLNKSNPHKVTNNNNSKFQSKAKSKVNHPTSSSIVLLKTLMWPDKALFKEINQLSKEPKILKESLFKLHNPSRILQKSVTDSLNRHRQITIEI